jgi:hypothetical protein
MAKLREKTQQIGFWDDELSSPDHDHIQVWTHKNIEKVLRLAIPEEFDRDWGPREVTYSSDNGVSDDQWTALKAKAIAEHPRPNPKANKIELEYTLVKRHGHNGQLEQIVGYADLMVHIGIPGLSAHDEEPFQVWFGGKDRILVEVKSKLPTLGELMRQINLYREAHRGKVVVVSPDDSYAEVLATQGVQFLKYEP